MELYLDMDLLIRTHTFITGPCLSLAAVSRLDPSWFGLVINQQLLQFVLSCRALLRYCGMGTVPSSTF